MAAAALKARKLQHQPIMTEQICAALCSSNEGASEKTFLDATFGRGGHSRALLAAGAAMVYGLDRDPEACAEGARLAAAEPRFKMLQGCFGDLAKILCRENVPNLSGILMDIGVSSPQLDDPLRGFSFREDGPLDMRMSHAGDSAADMVNKAEEADLADILFLYGEERAARRIARALVAARDIEPITRTHQLAEIIRRQLPRPKPGQIDSATRSFQALRIAVNDELGELQRGLAGAETVLAVGGRLAVITFHSLEDRMVKKFLAERSGKNAVGSRHLPPRAERAASFKLIGAQPQTANEEELAANPRARSAKLRVAERTAAEAWPAAHTGGQI